MSARDDELQEVVIQDDDYENSEDIYFCPERECLPFKKDPNQKISIWQVIKDSVGKDLTKITMPVAFNEPLSFTQKTAEVMEYEEFLVKANRCSDPIMRYFYVLAF